MRCCIALLILSFTTVALADHSLADLKLFKSAAMAKGLWQMQLLSSSDAAQTQQAAAAGKVGICMDMAQKLSEQGKVDKTECTPTVLKNTANEAEVTVACSNGHTSHLLMQRESAQSFLMTNEVTSKDQPTRTLKARYTYQGECKGDAMIQMDKSSETCKKMQHTDTKQMAGMCDKVPEGYRAQCQQQMKQMAGMCQ